MRFQVISDIRAVDNEIFPIEYINPCANYLIIAGGISKFSENQRETYHNFLFKISPLYKNIFIVVGSYDIDGSDITTMEEYITILSRIKDLCSKFKNINFLHNQSVEHDDFVVSGFTFYSKSSLNGELKSEVNNEAMEKLTELFSNHSSREDNKNLIVVSDWGLCSSYPTKKVPCTWIIGGGCKNKDTIDHGVHLISNCYSNYPRNVMDGFDRSKTFVITVNEEKKNREKYHFTSEIDTITPRSVPIEIAKSRRKYIDRYGTI